jgi:hypothetical protein
VVVQIHPGRPFEKDFKLRNREEVIPHMPVLVARMKALIPDAELLWDHRHTEDLFEIDVTRADRNYVHDVAWGEGVSFRDFLPFYQGQVERFLARVSQLAEESGLNP